MATAYVLIPMLFWFSISWRSLTPRPTQNADGIPISACPVGCALIFPIFVEECETHITTIENHAIAPYQTMAQSCLSIDGAAVVEYARDLMQQGCTLDFGRHRRMQIVSQWLTSPSQQCTFDDLDDRANEVDQVCCGNGECPNGIPNTCSPMCAVVFHEFMDECGATLNVVLGTGDGRTSSLTAFEGVCIGNLDTHAFLEAIANANCGDDVIGRVETCQEASDLSITFLGDSRDSSGNGRRVSLNGDVTVTTTGVQFDGDGDYFTVPSWGYSTDSDFTVAFWFVKEVCTTGLYEYLFSHSNHNDVTAGSTGGQPGYASIGMFLGCEGAGASTSTLNNAGTIMRYWLQDDVGSVAIFDYRLHDSGSFDAITNVWIQTIMVVTPTSMRTYDDGTLVSDALYGFPTRQASVANPMPSALSTPFTTMSMAAPMYIGGRSDLAGDRHFRGTMAMLMIDATSITDAQALCYFQNGDTALAALPPVPPPVDHGMSCVRAVGMMLQVATGADGALHMAAQDCSADDGSGGLTATCDGGCGVKWNQVSTSCAAFTPPAGLTACGGVTSRGVRAPCTSQRDQSAYNQAVMQQVAGSCAAAPPGCESATMMAITQQCNLPSPSTTVSPTWRPRCPCNAAILAPLISCRDSFGAQVGMSRQYLNAIRIATNDRCIPDAPSGGTSFTTVPTDGSEVGGEVVDQAGLFYQFHAEAGATYLLDTEVGTLTDTIMFLISTDQRTSIAENDDDSRVSGSLDSYIEWTCPCVFIYT